MNRERIAKELLAVAADMLAEDSNAGKRVAQSAGVILMDSISQIRASDFIEGRMVEFVASGIQSRATMSSALHMPIAPLSSVLMNTQYEVLEVTPKSVVLLREGDARMFDEVEVPFALLNRAKGGWA